MAKKISVKGHIRTRKVGEKSVLTTSVDSHKRSKPKSKK